MKEHAIEAQVRGFILQHFPLARKNGFQGNEKWLESGMIDSLGILDLVHFLEKEFALQISDEDLSPENFESMSAVVVFVQARMRVTAANDSLLPGNSER